jgi:hypothetical protein
MSCVAAVRPVGGSTPLTLSLLREDVLAKLTHLLRNYAVQNIKEHEVLKQKINQNYSKNEALENDHIGTHKKGINFQSDHIQHGPTRIFTKLHQPI